MARIKKILSVYLESELELEVLRHEKIVKYKFFDEMVCNTDLNMGV